MSDRTTLTREIQYLVARSHPVALFVLATMLLELELEELETVLERAVELTKATASPSSPPPAYVMLLAERYAAK